MYDGQTEMAIIIEWFFKIIFGDVASLGTKMKAWLLMNPCADYYFIDGYTRVENPFYNFWSGAGVSIQSILSGVATTMCGIFFVVEFAKTLSRVEGTTYEAVVGLGCKFCFARLAISLGDKLMTALTITGANIISKVSSIATTSFAFENNKTMVHFYNNIFTATKDVGITGFFALIVVVIIPCLVVKAVTLIAMIMAYGRLLELMFYHAFMPLPMGCLFIDNARITKRFFASYFATILQGVFMFIGYSIFISNIVPAMQPIADEVPSGVDVIAKMLFKVVMWGIMMVIIMMKSGSWASKMVGEG